MPNVSLLLKDAETFGPLHAIERPIFRWDRAEYAMFYAPGCLCVVGLPDAEWFENTVVSEQGQGVDWGGELWRRAELAVAAARRWQESPFSPECLTLYMNNECNLGCVYCYADPSHHPELTTGGPAPRLELETIAAAAQVVAENCRAKGRPFYSVFHGGGEPTLHRERAERALSLLDAVAATHGVERFGYVATNGVMSTSKAVWLARRFDLVGLSCDGPADIQNYQRPLGSGGPSAQGVEQTARILRAEGQRVHVRATITRMNVQRQVEIVEYLCDKFLPEEIHFEPMYAGGRADTVEGLGPLDAPDFVEHFLQARQKAQDYDVPLLYAGCRLCEVHGPYCNVFRDVLNLIPGGVATACFKMTNASQARASGMVVGALQSGRFVIDHNRVRTLRLRLAAPRKCHACFNRFHCAGECPETCSINDGDCLENDFSLPGATFRCQVQKAIAAATLLEMADVLWSAAETTSTTRQVGNGKVYGATIL